MGAVDDLYTEEDEKEAKIKQFAKKFARVGAMREGIRRNKEFYFQNTIETLKERTFDPPRIAQMLSGFEPKL